MNNLLTNHSTGESHILREGDVPISTFYSTLQSVTAENKDDIYARVITHLAELGPSATEMEFRLLREDTDTDLKAAMQFFCYALENCSDYDLVEAWLCLFLKLHSDAIAVHPSLSALSLRLEEYQNRSWGRLEGLFHHALCLINVMTGVGLTG